MSRDDAHLLDIAIAARRIIGYTDGRSIDDFISNEPIQDAVLYQFAIIGEASRRLSEAFRVAHPELPWAAMIGMRNVVIHQYDNISFDRVWDAVQRTVPDALAAIERLIPLEEPSADEHMS